MLHLTTPLIHAPGAVLDDEAEAAGAREGEELVAGPERSDSGHSSLRGTHEDAVADLAGEHDGRPAAL
jgi:hypothetical protein